MPRRLAAAALLITLAACAEKPAPPPQATPQATVPPPAAPTPAPPKATLPGFSLSAVSFTDLPGWRDDKQADALGALRRSCAALLAQPADRPVGAGGVAGTAGQWRAACTAAQSAKDGDARDYFEGQFRPYRVRAADGKDGLFTGYYEPTLRGAKARGGRYTVPIYRRPPDLDPKAGPYLDRAAIDAGALAGKKLELAWVDDAIDAFFLQVQGSGRIELAGGEVMRVGYAGDNGRKYVPIGRVLIERGVFKPDEVSLQSIREWLRANPKQAPALMRENPRYIFFRVLETDGPIGAGGVALSAGRSLAVDPAFIPLGAPLWLDTTWPGPEAKPLRRLVVAQDTGSAIKGAVRGDVFWGLGPEAEWYAGQMRQPGAYFLFLPVGITPPGA
jgi:membrane-bound lytic murein transglycosylase A